MLEAQPLCRRLPSPLRALNRGPTHLQARLRRKAVQLGQLLLAKPLQLAPAVGQQLGQRLALGVGHPADGGLHLALQAVQGQLQVAQEGGELLAGHAISWGRAAESRRSTKQVRALLRGRRAQRQGDGLLDLKFVCMTPGDLERETGDTWEAQAAHTCGRPPAPPKLPFVGQTAGTLTFDTFQGSAQ